MSLYRYDAIGYSTTDGVIRAKNRKEAEQLAREEASRELDSIVDFNMERIPKEDEEDYT